MFNLIKFETRKIFHRKSLYICFGISAFVLWLMATLLGRYENKLEMEASSADNFIVNTMGNSSFLMLFGIMVALYACEDYVNNTLKNVYSKGFSRISVYFSKYIVSLIVVIAEAMLLMFLSYILGFIYGTLDTSITSGVIERVVLQLILIIGFHSLYFATSTALAKSGPAIVLIIMGFDLLVVSLDIILALLKIENFEVSKYWINNQFDIVSSGHISNTVCANSIIMTICYVIIPTIAGIFAVKRKEL